jgi:hypothetical protein
MSLSQKSYKRKTSPVDPNNQNGHDKQELKFFFDLNGYQECAVLILKL